MESIDDLNNVEPEEARKKRLKQQQKRFEEAEQGMKKLFGKSDERNKRKIEKLKNPK